MLLDWITARISLDHLTDEGRAEARLLSDRIARYCPRTGEVRFESSAWDSIRSDSHQITLRVTGSEFWIQGSPARVTGDGCAVFGSGASARLSIAGCLDAMRLFVQQQTGILLPADVALWTVSRVDVTGNLLLGSQAEVLEGLRVLRNCEGGRYRVSQQAGDTVYWSHKSKLRSGKAYAKGAHIEYMQKQKIYSGRVYTIEEMIAAQSLLRLELKLGREFFQRQNWRTLTAEMLTEEWRSYFERMVGACEMTNDNDLKEKIISAACAVQIGTDREGNAIYGTDTRGKAAYGCWLLIQSEGWERARESFTKTTWYRHLQILRKAGLGDADISAGVVVPLRRKILEAREVSSWSQILRAA